MPAQTSNPSLEARLAHAEENQNDYRSSQQAVQDRLAKVSLVLIVGPWGIGKSHTIRAITELSSDFSDFNNILTRPRRGDDPPNYRTDQPIEEVLDRIETGEIAQYTVHPTTKHIYASDADSYPTDYVTMPALYSAIPQINKVGFNQVVLFGLLAEGATWEEQLKERTGEIQQEQRLLEARQCVCWLLANQHNVHILENKTGHADVNARTIIDTTLDIIPAQPLGKAARLQRLATELLEVADKRLEGLGLDNRKSGGNDA